MRRGACRYSLASGILRSGQAASPAQGRLMGARQRAWYPGLLAGAILAKPHDWQIGDVDVQERDRLALIATARAGLLGAGEAHELRELEPRRSDEPSDPPRRARGEHD